MDLQQCKSNICEKNNMLNFSFLNDYICIVIGFLGKYWF
jgi:hypothetical protein